MAAVVLAATVVTSAISVRRDAHDVSASAAVALLATGLLATSLALAEPPRTLVLGTAAALLLVAATSLSRRPVGPLAGHLVGTVGAAGTVLAVLAVLSGAPERFVTTGLLLLALAGLAAAGVSRSRTSLALASGVTLVAVLGWAQHPLATVTASAAGAHDMVVALVDSILVAAVVATGLWAVGAQRGLGPRRAADRDRRRVGARPRARRPPCSSPWAPCSGPRPATPRSASPSATRSPR